MLGKYIKRIIMKDIKDYIIEAKDIHSKWKDVAKKLSKEDKEWIKKYAFDKKRNQIYTMEELEKRMWKGDLKDQIEDIYDHLIDSILYENNKITARDIIDAYSLSRTGKQSKIEVIAQALYMINMELDW